MRTSVKKDSIKKEEKSKEKTKQRKFSLGVQTEKNNKVKCQLEVKMFKHRVVFLGEVSHAPSSTEEPHHTLHVSLSLLRQQEQCSEEEEEVSAWSDNQDRVSHHW